MRSVLLLGLLLFAGCVQLQDPSPTGTGSSSPLNEGQSMVYVPVQCNGNPWQDASWSHDDDQSAKEAKAIADHFAAKNVTLRDVRFEDVYTVVCEACHCPRGDWILANIPADDAGEARQLGWEYESHMSRPPRSS